MLKIVCTLSKDQTMNTMPTWANMIPSKDQEVPKKTYPFVMAAPPPNIFPELALVSLLGG